MQELLDDAVAASLTFNRLIQGFMALGLWSAWPPSA